MTDFEFFFAMAYFQWFLHKRFGFYIIVSMEYVIYAKRERARVRMRAY